MDLDGGDLGSQLFRRLTEEESYSIMSCIEQFCRRDFDKTKFFCIQVWFPDDANKRYNSNTPSNGFLIQSKLEENYVNKDLLTHAKSIWDAGSVPVEINRDNRSAFFAVSRKDVLANTDHFEYMMAYAEDGIPVFD